MKNLKLKAFTLAEVLITLGIIGVVSAMVIPTLTQNIQKKKIESQVKLSFAQVQQAMRLAVADGADFDMAIADGSDASMKAWFDEFVLPNIKTSSVCYDSAGCWHKKGEVKTLDNQPPTFEQSNSIGGNSITFILQNGTLVDVDGNSSTTMADLYGVVTPSDSLVFIFDANGFAKPNIIGKDIYVMAWTSNGLIPAGSSNTPAQVSSNCLSGNGYFCLEYMKSNNWKMSDSVWQRKS